ncbi:MAG: hypothetical protein Q4A31_11210 [Corynebacterium sp.]|uniref:hypothetical protein n=1 Tax=Corynebacterium sp. TaxID=1720 RepID=UPI0026DA96B3|nr:hypothetical protein [Corynebacterium sp.]MDO4762479.1 hypothetical protein [Corynebacterium sp.]
MRNALPAGGQKFVEDFIRRTCRPDFRTFEHAFSTHAVTALWLSTLPDFIIPAHADYIRDWACGCADRISDFPCQTFGKKQLPKTDDYRARFLEHLQLGAQLSVPATGPFGALVPAGVQRGWISRDHAFGICLVALECAQRPGDRKKWVGILSTTLAITDEELCSHVEVFAGVLSTGEAPVVETIGVPLIRLVPADKLGDIAVVCLFTKTNKALVAVLAALHARIQNLSQAHTADIAMLIGSRVEQLAQQRNAQVKKAASTLLEDLHFSPDIASHSDDSANVNEPTVVPWRPIPPLWSIERFSLPACTAHELALRVAAINTFGIHTGDLRDEEFLYIAHDLRRSAPDSYSREISRLQNFPVDNLADTGSVEWKEPSWAVSLPMMRTLCVLSHAESIPTVLSLPTWVDYSISTEDFCSRLEEYDKAGLAVYSPDLLLAVFRLDDIAAALEHTTNSTVPIVGVDGQPVAHTIGEIISFIASHDSLHAQESQVTLTPSGDEKCSCEILCDSLRTIANLFPHKTYLSCSYDLFPHSDKDVFNLVRWFEDSFAFLGPIALQAACSRAPLAPEVCVNLLGAQRTKDPKILSQCRQALHTAFDRGLIHPDHLKGTDLDYDYFPQNIAAFAHAMRECAEEGFLSIIWPVLDGIVEASAQKQRLFAGTAEIAALMDDLAPSVIHAVKTGEASDKNLQVPGLRLLAQRKGKSQAVVTAKEAVEKLPAQEATAGDGVEKPQLQAPENFEHLWPEQAGCTPHVDDGVTVTNFALVASHTNKKRAEITLSVPGFSDPIVVRKHGWFYDIEEEGQVGCLKGEEDGYLYKEGNSFFFSPWRNRNKQTDSPLRGVQPDEFPNFLSLVVIASLSDEYSMHGARMSVRTMIRKNRFCGSASAHNFMEQLVQCADFAPHRCVNMMAEVPETFPWLWPAVTVPLSYAASCATPPTWTSRILDFAIEHAGILAEATRRGYIPATKWDSLHALAAMKKKCAAKTKAQRLTELFDSYESS